MKLEIQREQMLKPLQAVLGAVDRRQTLPILGHVLLTARDQELQMTATDLETELSTQVPFGTGQTGSTTLPARRLYDILKSFPEESLVVLSVEDKKATLRCGRSRFVLNPLPVEDFPTLDEVEPGYEIHLPQGVLRNLIERSHYAMAQQDVRYYLNGLLLEIAPQHMRLVATDGHRLALQEHPVEGSASEVRQAILPRKGVLELLRLLTPSDAEAVLQLGRRHARVLIGEVRFTSKLIDGTYPDYQRVIPKAGNRIVIANRQDLRNALARASLVLNDRNTGITLALHDWKVVVKARNADQEEAEEEVEVHYNGGPLEIGFNAGYLLDALGALTGELAKLSFTDALSSCLIEEGEGQGGRHVVMPMRL